GIGRREGLRGGSERLHPQAVQSDGAPGAGEGGPALTCGLSPSSGLAWLHSTCSSSPSASGAGTGSNAGTDDGVGRPSVSDRRCSPCSTGTRAPEKGSTARRP